MFSLFAVHSLGVLRIGTRPSPLARVQAESVQQALHTASPDMDIEIVELTTTGDTNLRSDRPLGRVGRTVDFTGIIDDAIIDDHVDLGVHSLKDIPPAHRWAGRVLTVGAHLPRVDPCDVLVGDAASIRDLPLRARVGTASVRRQAQLLALRSDLMLVNVRGNVHDRLRMLETGHVDALLLARAGLERLGLEGLGQMHSVPADDILPG